VKVCVDQERCQGHTLCAMIAPEMFRLSDLDGTSSAVTEVVPTDQEEAVREAARSCPEQAIALEENEPADRDKVKESAQ
jgi:ferredoxin